MFVARVETAEVSVFAAVRLTQNQCWEEHRLQPHRVRIFKRSHDRAFAAKVEDVVCLYMNPPAHDVMLSIDEQNQSQAVE